MIITLCGGQLHGKAVIIDPDGRTYAEFSYKNGNGNGKCNLYYESGELFFRGYLVSGYREGLGVEYDEKGNVIFDGFFTKGVRNHRILKNKVKEGYWNEMDERAIIISLCHKDKHGRNDGICYFYSNSLIDHISRWEKGVEIEFLHVFSGDIMESYIDGELVYIGSYRQLSEFEFVPKYDVVENEAAVVKKRKKGKKAKKSHKIHMNKLKKASSISLYLAFSFLAFGILFLLDYHYNKTNIIQILCIVFLVLFFIFCLISCILSIIIFSKNVNSSINNTL